MKWCNQSAPVVVKPLTLDATLQDSLKSDSVIHTYLITALLICVILTETFTLGALLL